MKYFEVGFKVADGIFSVNTIWANTGREELEAVTETAERKAQKHGYEIAYIKEIAKWQVEEACRRGRPMYPIDDEAERAHDPSFQDDPEPDEAEEDEDWEEEDEDSPYYRPSDFRDYTPSAPWKAPGMTVSDFIH